MKSALIGSLGWLATAIFVASYFFKRPALLRTAQMCGAALWILYGVLIQAAPVIGANALVLIAAGWTAYSAARSVGTPSSRSPERVGNS